MIGRQTRHYQPGTVLSSWESEIPSHYIIYGHSPGRCRDKPSPACEHAAVPSSRAELLIITIAKTNNNNNNKHL